MLWSTHGRRTMAWRPVTNPEAPPCPSPYAPRGAVSTWGMAGSSWPGYALPGDAVYCPALAVANNGLSPDTGPVEVYRWCHPHWRWAVTSADL
jgi:hypothetical protein